MHTRLKMSRDGLELLKEFEGLRLAAARLPDGRWTMGHGHTQYAREGATITAADAEALLIYDLIPVAAAVNDGVTRKISQNQFDALSCFAFNVGIEAFQQSEVLQRVNQERMTEAALAMAIWRAGAFNGRRVVLDALVRRRSAEESMLLGGEGRPAPSDLVRPQIDPDAQASLPTTMPAVVEVQFDGATAEARLVEEAGSDSTSTDPTSPFSPEAEPGHETDDSVTVDVDPAVVDAAEGGTPQEAFAGGAEPIAYAAPVEEPTTAPADASLSTRIYANYLPERFSPLAAAEAEADLEQTTGLMEPPAIEAQIDEPPLVLVLTPPPEVSSELPEVSMGHVSPSIQDAPASEEQPPLFEAGPQPISDDEAVIYYEPLAEPDNGASRWSDTGAFVATGIVGLAAFGFGIAGFQLAGQDPVPTGMFDEKTAISWVLVAIGVVCVWIAAYNLFKRLGGPEGE